MAEKEPAKKAAKGSRGFTDEERVVPSGLDEMMQALVEEGASLDALLGALPESAWRQSTRCPEWDVFTLVAHLARTIRTLTEYAEQPFSGPVESHDSSQGNVNARARAAAEGQTPATLRAALREAVRSAVATAKRLGPEATLHTRFGPVRLDRWLESRVVEACVHGLDLRLALGKSPTPTPLALKVAAQRMEQRLGEPRPQDLSEDVAFVEAASGRRAHPHPRFPLMR